MPELGLDLEWALKNLEFRQIEQHAAYGPLLEQLLVKRFDAKMSARKIAELYRFPPNGVRRVLRNAGVVLSPKSTPSESAIVLPESPNQVAEQQDVPRGEPVCEQASESGEPFSPRVSDTTLHGFAKGIGEAIRSARNGRGWTRKELRHEMGSCRSLQTIATHELGTRLMSISQFAEYCHALGVQPGPLFDRVYHKMFGSEDDETVTVDLEKLAMSECPNLARWAGLRRNELPPSSSGMLPLPLHAQDTLAALCGFDRRQLLEMLSAV